MNHNFKRTEKIAGMIRRKLALIIPQEVKDPRLTGLVTISRVNISADLAHAKVYFTVFNMDKALTSVILNAASSYLRTALSRSMTIRTIPQLHFIYDESIEYSERLTRLIDKVNKDDDN